MEQKVLRYELSVVLTKPEIIELQKFMERLPQKKYEDKVLTNWIRVKNPKYNPTGKWVRI